jgi:hypothetical protein
MSKFAVVVSTFGASLIALAAFCGLKLHEVVVYISDSNRMLMELADHADAIGARKSGIEQLAAVVDHAWDRFTAISDIDPLRIEAQPNAEELSSLNPRLFDAWDSLTSDRSITARFEADEALALTELSRAVGKILDSQESLLRKTSNLLNSVVLNETATREAARRDWWGAAGLMIVTVSEYNGHLHQAFDQSLRTARTVGLEVETTRSRCRLMTLQMWLSIAGLLVTAVAASALFIWLLSGRRPRREGPRIIVP